MGGPNDVVVERNIQRGQRPLPEATLRPEPSTEPLPDPLAEAGRLPEPPRAIAEGMPRRAEPAFEMPVVVPAPVPGSQATPAVRLPLDAALIGGDEPGRDIPVPPQTAAQAIPQAPARTRPLRTTLPPSTGSLPPNGRRKRQGRTSRPSSCRPFRRLPSSRGPSIPRSCPTWPGSCRPRSRGRPPRPPAARRRDRAPGRAGAARTCSGTGQTRTSGSRAGRPGADGGDRSPCHGAPHPGAPCRAPLPR
ncbi:hypothetical protein ACFQFG_08675 [Methylobacterium persicinum]